MENLTFKRIHLVVMDSVGIGEAPDAKSFGDEGSDTLGHIAERMGGLKMPNIEKMGLSNIRPIKGIAPVDKPTAHFGKLQEASVGKNTMTGHWEIMGLNINKPFNDMYNPRLYFYFYGMKLFDINCFNGNGQKDCIFDWQILLG